MEGERAQERRPTAGREPGRPGHSAECLSCPHPLVNSTRVPPKASTMPLVVLLPLVAVALLSQPTRGKTTLQAASKDESHDVGAHYSRVADFSLR